MSMSTQEWVAALGLFLTHPELLMATLIIAGAAFSIAWWLRGHFLQARSKRLQNERDATASERDAARCENEQLRDAARRENEQLKQSIEALEQENAALRAQIPQVLNPDTNRVLEHMFKAHQPIDFDTMATALSMEGNELQDHLDQLNKYGFATRTNVNSLDQKIYWRLTSGGRKRVFDGVWN